MNPNSKVHGAHIGPTWGQQDPGVPHVGPTKIEVVKILGPGRQALTYPA